MTKARPDGANYVHGLMVGYEAPPPGLTMGEGMNYNKYFPGHQIAMVQPLNANQVTYSDGTPASVDQMAKDVATFLAWSAEPEMEERKRTGIKVILFLLVLTGLLYAAKRKIWAAIH